MKKSVIALAIATAATPFAAQADTTLTGSVTAKYYVSTNDAARIAKGLDVDSDLDISSTEVLANGMTATASMDIGDHGATHGKAGLAGDFGTVTIGSGLDSDGAFQSGDVAGAVSNATNADSTSASATNAINYTGSFSGLNIQFQLNSISDANGTSVAKTAGSAETYSTQIGASYMIMDGLTVGLATISADPDADDSNGLDSKATAYGVKYAVDSLEVTFGSRTLDDGNSDNDKAVIGAKYTMGEVSATLTLNQNNTVGKNKLVVAYAGADNGVSATATYDTNKSGDNSKMKLTAGYKTGDLSFSVTNQHDKSLDFGVAYDMGNADLNLDRDGSKSQTTIQYKVAF